jgi:hypothetical protein
MKHSAKIRFIATAGFFAFSTLLPAQIPPPAAGMQQPLPLSQQAPQPPQVTYSEGKLFVSAANSSLNQILRDIAHETGMKITGGVTDERVFGKYGPAAPSQILAALLDGTGSNMLLLQATAATPAELILTPRHGGPTPPNPNAAEAEEEMPPPPPRPQYSPATPPQQAAPNPAATQPAQPKTPQQIYEQLQRLRQQQQSNPK